MGEVGGFLVELGLLLLLLGVLGTAARRVGLSPVPLFVLAGLFLGDGGVASVAATAPFVETTAEIGVLLLLLLLGLEFSAAEFTASMRRHGPSGAVDFALNAPPGYLAGVLLGFPWQACLALAGITWISSSGIVARLISDLGRTAFRETPAVLSVLVLEDLAMAVYLPVLAVLLAGGTPGRAGAGAVLAVAVVVTLLVLVRRFGDHLGRLIQHEDDEQILLRVLGLTLLVGGFSYLLGASAAVGAFLVGLAIPGETARRARAVLTPLRDLFAAIFFLSFGLRVDPTEVLPALPVALALAVVTAGTKVATGWYAARRDGVGRRGRVRAGVSLVARGEFSILIAGLAILAGYTEIGPLASAYVLVLGVGGPLLARGFGRRSVYPVELTPRRAGL
ncbi:cation:proton antiporter [Pengzhenrongella frigida]|uniref:Cation:proton antiporter n=1 Tax=Pengzhenrongella frigida TaxID=1259133 RepID=A0A4Q5N446_9MICO|nr:cation:proton antiporter [Cellulomonas sp. HLT2-17]RYV52945.1 cation:proton antiporter [Cellulomonas sp. HLT2-17]